MGAEVYGIPKKRNTCLRDMMDTMAWRGQLSYYNTVAETTGGIQFFYMQLIRLLFFFLNLMATGIYFFVFMKQSIVYYNFWASMLTTITFALLFIGCGM